MKGKTEWFGSDEWTFGPKAMEVKAEIEEKIKVAEQGGQLTFIFTDTLKEKLDQRKKCENPDFLRQLQWISSLCSECTLCRFWRI